MVDPNHNNLLQNSSSTTISWEVLCDDFNNNNTIDLVRQLEQSMEFQNQSFDDDNDDDGWSEPNDDNNKNENYHKDSMNHNKSNYALSQIPEVGSSEQTLWKIRFLCLIGFNVFLIGTTTAFNVILHMTPDDDKEKNELLSLIPVILNILQFIIMILFYFVFCIYNHHVQHTNTTILQKSNKALQFVAQMFPENLRQQLFHHNDNNNTVVINNKSSRSNSKSLINSSNLPIDIESATIPTPITTFSMTNSDTTITATTIDTINDSNIHGTHRRTNIVVNNTNNDNDDNYIPIAELYPETTVMLADLAGFTAWSAVHEPSEVFRLLETIFYEFDVLALKRQIYKVETVGDCYVAVAGVPIARPDHGVVMARFARECMMRFQSIIPQLEERFGTGTNALGMRIGLNSGPITGGVLRGERSRFQLFGDTINTAARMESNSCKGRIQVSETTAQLLFNANKHHWLIKRDDEIEAKGKGTLQTYWLDINANHGSMLGSAVGVGENINKPMILEEFIA